MLYAFKGGNDGQSPMANLVFDKAGNIYGTTRYGGANDEGTVFELTPKTRREVDFKYNSHLWYRQRWH